MSDDQAEAVAVDVDEPEVNVEESQAETEEVTSEVVEDGDQSEEQETEEQDGPGIQYEEVELEGKTYKVPSELKSNFMMQKDYTQKTQEVAEQRKEFESELKRVRDIESNQQQNLKTYAEITALEQHIEGYKDVDWDTLYKQSSTEANQHQFRYNQLKDLKAEKEKELAEQNTKALQQQQQNAAKQLEESKKRVASEIKGWDSKMAQTVSKKITELGYSAEFKNALDKGAFPDAVPMIKTIHKAAEYDKLMAKAKKVKSSPSDVVEIRPTKKVQGGSTLRKTIYDKTLTSEQRISLRNKQLKQNN